jgi:HK97 family phage portal protein
MGFLNGLARVEEQRGSVVLLHPRDPALADFFGGGASTTAGVTVTPDSARECPEVDACVGLNEDTIATVPLDLFERKSEDERERASGHPLHELLHDSPNSWQSSAEFRQMMEGYRETHGNAYARVISKNSGFPVALEPVHPREMRPFQVGLTPSGERKVAYRWTPPDSTARILMQHEVLHLRDTPARQSNLVEGESKVERHRETIGQVLATGQYLSRYFRNNATPKIAIEVPGNLNDTSVEALRDQFMRLQGAGNMHKPYVAHSGVKVAAIGATNDEAQVVPIYEQGVSQLSRIFEVPGFLIGDMAKQTSWGTGIEQQSIGFVVYYMRSKFVVWEQALNKTLMSAATRQKFYFEFNIDALLRGDFKTRMEGYALMIQWALASPNTIRRWMNLPPDKEHGEERLQPLNMVPVSKVMDVLLKTSPGPQARSLDDAALLLNAIIADRSKMNGNGAHQ